MAHEKFDVAKLERLNDPARLTEMDPAVMWSALGSPKPRVIVEIGAGTGVFAERFSILAEGARVYAVDNEPVMVDWMLQHRANLPEACIVPVLSEETGVPLSDAIADLVVMINLHHELADPRAIYSEAARLVRSGGQALVVDWAPGAPGQGPSDGVRVDAQCIAAALEGAGFRHTAMHSGLPRHSLVTARKP